MTRIARASQVALAILALASLGARGGCGPSGGTPVAPQTDTCAASTPPPADGKATVVLGRDVTGPFQALLDGDALPLNHGPQGGQHIYVTVRLYAPSAGSWKYALAMKETSGVSAGSATVALGACAGWNTSEKVRVILDTSAAHAGPLSIVASPVSDPTATLSETVNVSVTP